SNGVCTASTDDVTIQLDQNPTTSAAGPDQNICGASATLAANVATIGTGAWTVVSGAGGSFVAATSPTTVFNGSAGVTYVLRWTITNGLVCAPSTDDVQIRLDQAPTTSAAGADQSAATAICGNSATLAANTPAIGTGAWSIVSGAGGSFVSATNPTTIFNGIAGTTYQLRWTISNGVCAASTDDVTI